MASQKKTRRKSRSTEAAATPPVPAGRRKRAAAAVQVPDLIYAQVSPTSVDQVSLFDFAGPIDVETVGHFASTDDVIHRAAARLEEAGFQVLDVNRLTINICGSKRTFDKAFGTEVYAEERPAQKNAVPDVATFLDVPDNPRSGLILTKGSRFADVIEGVALEEPRYYMAASPLPRTLDYWHLDVPADVSLGCNADRAHRAGITGRGVDVVMVDSGWYRHPFFVQRGYRAGPVVLAPGAANPDRDESGHGTGESANVFAVAPDVNFRMVKMSFVNTIAAFNAAVALNPQVISCSWGSSKQNGPLSAADAALAAAIAAAVARGIVVVFSAGNGHWGFPGQHPDVISAGGAFMSDDGAFRASNYASGFMSNIYANRRVPDLCGLVGELPRAIYIQLPVEPGDQLDTGLAGGSFPNGDETGARDGWAVFSGTSAAAPQLAGAAALIRQACGRLTPAQVRDILRRTARDVTTGHCNPSTGGHAATVGVDNATGHGVVDAHRAAMLARLRCIGPIRPILPIRPIEPIRPVGPIVPPIVPPPIVPPIVPPPIGPTPPPPPVGGPTPASELVAGATTPPAQHGVLTQAELDSLEDLVLRGQLDDIDN